MEDRPTGIERRMVHRLLVHWRDAREDGALPTLDAVLKRDLGDIGPSIFVLRVVDGESEPAFERVGDAFAGEMPPDLTGRPVSAVPAGTLLAQAVGRYRMVLSKKVPMTTSGEFRHAQGGTVLYRSILLPVSEGRGTIDFLLGAANCRKKANDA